MMLLYLIRAPEPDITGDVEDQGADPRVVGGQGVTQKTKGVRTRLTARAVGQGQGRVDEGYSLHVLFL